MLHRALRALRRFHGVKQTELAAAIGISNSYLSEIESGAKAHAITVDVLRKYADVFDLPVSSILLFSEQMQSETRSERLRVLMADKVLNLLNWIDQEDEQNGSPA